MKKLLCLLPLVYYRLFFDSGEASTANTSDRAVIKIGRYVNDKLPTSTPAEDKAFIKATYAVMNALDAAIRGTAANQATQALVAVCKRSQRQPQRRLQRPRGSDHEENALVCFDRRGRVCVVARGERQEEKAAQLLSSKRRCPPALCSRALLRPLKMAARLITPKKLSPTACELGAVCLQ